jgi:hypothetical protein
LGKNAKIGRRGKGTDRRIGWDIQEIRSIVNSVIQWGRVGEEVGSRRTGINDAKKAERGVEQAGRARGQG